MTMRWMTALWLLLALTLPAAAQDRAQVPRQMRLPSPSVTHHMLDLPGRQLRITATAGGIVVPDATGAPQAEVAYIAYALDGADPHRRPVTFVFNGGPGFASAWLQLGAVGPWRLRMGGPGDEQDGIPSAQPDLLPNAETWLDFTDLVFIDPVGTGYSHIVAGGADARKRLWSVNGDIAYLAETVRRWLAGAGRVASPKFLLGESYGGFRVPRLARALQEDEGIGVNGLILVSPVLDFGGRSSAFDPLFWAEHLPSLAAVERAKTGAVSREQLADVEAYATGEFLHDQIASSRDPVARQRMAARVAALTGVDPALVLEEGGGIQIGTFLRQTQPGRIASIYDATISNPAAIATNPYFREPEASLARLTAPFTSAMLELYEHRLAWRPDSLYRLRNADVERQWDWGRGLVAPESVTALRVALAVDPRLRVLVAHGLFDLITPYFATAMILDHLPDIGAPGRVKLVTYPGGHMFYSRDESRAAFREEAKRLIERE
ncbi:MAG: septum formation initiator [Acetobacteraceae bacterium]